MTPVDVDRESAHEAAVRELAGSIYPKPSLSDRFLSWLQGLLQRLVDTGASLPGGWLTVVALALLVAALAGVAVHVARRTMGGGVERRLYSGQVLGAADHRWRASQLAERGDWDAAIRQRVQAIGRQLEEDGVLHPVAGRTADELAREAGLLLPEFSTDLTLAASVFDDVTYGEQPGSEKDYRLISALDDRLLRRSGTTEAGVR